PVASTELLVDRARLWLRQVRLTRQGIGYFAGDIKCVPRADDDQQVGPAVKLKFGVLRGVRMKLGDCGIDNLLELPEHLVRSAVAEFLTFLFIAWLIWVTRR